MGLSGRRRFARGRPCSMAEAWTFPLSQPPGLPSLPGHRPNDLFDGIFAKLQSLHIPGIDGCGGYASSRSSKETQNPFINHLLEAIGPDRPIYLITEGISQKCSGETASILIFTVFKSCQ